MEPPAAERASPEAGEAAETWPEAPEQAASPADAEADPLEQYPALLAMVREMAGRSDPAAVK